MTQRHLANYVELVEAGESSEPPREASPPPAVSAPLAPPAPQMPSRPTGQAKTSGPRARALYDYVADEDNEICEKAQTQPFLLVNLSSNPFFFPLVSFQ
jgi:hypothetical protein